MGNNKIKTQMKFVLALLAVVAAQDEEEAAAVDCAEAGCAEGECCGWSKPDEPEGEEEEEEGGEEGEDKPAPTCHAEGDFTTTNDDDEEVAMEHHCMKSAQYLAAGVAALAVAALQ